MIFVVPFGTEVMVEAKIEQVKTIQDKGQLEVVQVNASTNIF